MNWAKIRDGSERRHRLVFSEGDEIADGMLEYARRQQITSGSFSGIGAFRRAELRYFDLFVPLFPRGSRARDSRVALGAK